MNRKLAMMGLSSILLLGACQNEDNKDEEKVDKVTTEQATTEVHKDEHNHEGHDHDHDHDHGNETEEDKQVYKGYFKDSQVADRELTDWQSSWQSVYPYLQDGTLDPVFEKKAKEDSKMTAKEYKDYYTKGYKTDVKGIDIGEKEIIFHKEKEDLQGNYEYDGKEILTYEKGNRGVRFIFKKVSGDEEAPKFVQFSDHNIAPKRVSHYHLYMGDDRAELLKELEHWPTYYFSDESGEDIVEDMMHH